MKKSNISKAWKSTLLGICLGILTSASTVLAQGEFNWKSVLAGAIPAIILSVTDFLNEIKKDVESV
jgi:uncharacterized membrane protein YfcA